MGNHFCCHTEVEEDSAYEIPELLPQPRFTNEIKILKDENKENRNTYKMYDTCTNSDVTCKRITTRKRRRAQREAMTLRKFNSPYLPKYIDFSEDINVYNIYYTFIPGVDLFTYIFNNLETLCTSQIKIFIKKMLTCLVELKNYNLCHLDIKFENYIYDDATEKVTLIDFESAHPYIKNNALKILKTYVGTKSYAPPEIWYDYYHKNSDMWSIGVCLWTVMTLNYPFRLGKLSRHGPDLKLKIRKRCKFPTERHTKLMEELDFNNDLKDFFIKTFEFSPSKRITLDEMMNHNWLKVLT